MPQCPALADNAHDFSIISLGLLTYGTIISTTNDATAPIESKVAGTLLELETKTCMFQESCVI